jgi:hypothetical protein
MGGLGGSRRKYITRTDLRRFSEVGKHIGQRRCDAIGTRVARPDFSEIVAEWHGICTRPESQVSNESEKVFSKSEVLVPQGVMTIPKNLFYFPAVQV